MEFREKKYIFGRMLDIGCGEKPFRDFFKNHVSEHIGLDTEQTLHERSAIDLFATAYKIPAPDASFDSALCTAVLEHLEEPELALRECVRILKPGGYALYTIPFIWHLHEEPRDFYRYSKYGIQYLFTKSGFEITELRAAAGFWATFGQLFVYNLYRFNRGPLRWLRIIDLLAIIIQLIAYGLNVIDKTEQWTWLYLVVARKPV